MCHPCVISWRTKERLQAADFLTEAKWLEGWLDRHANDPPAQCKGLTNAEVELALRLPPYVLVDMRLVYRGKYP
jgi:hypothetical protein